MDVLLPWRTEINHSNNKNKKKNTISNEERKKYYAEIIEILQDHLVNHNVESRTIEYVLCAKKERDRNTTEGMENGPYSAQPLFEIQSAKAYRSQRVYYWVSRQSQSNNRIIMNLVDEER